MALTIQIAHDFSCPWCWIGLNQADRLRADFSAQIEWLAYELWPEELGWPEPGAPAPAENPDRPKVPSRLALAYAAEGIEPHPTLVRPRQMRTHSAHEAVEYAKTIGLADEMVRRIYEAYWLRAENIGKPEVLRCLADDLVPDLEDFTEAIQTRRFADRIVGFDEPAYATGIYNVPTFIIAGERYAEQPYRVLELAARAASAAS